MTVHCFPDRGGTGWRCSPKAKWGDFDLTNVSLIAQAFWQKHGLTGYAVLGIVPTPAMLRDAKLVQIVADIASGKTGAA